ncbi:hypothetical protein AB1Y20_011338 [Prymnesium parvum]|uniref:Uncharacterized protein n=1 Tax=Prymnesium parvum TaxID=97485 RepID=A0AB34IMK3_PRYPA
MPQERARAAAQAHVAAVLSSGGGLAGAEKRLATMQLNAGAVAVQRQLTQLRVDYLSQLNLQTTLLAGMGVSMLGSLELEAIEPAVPHRAELLQFVLCLLYVCGACTVLGASTWVLYSSNNLINLATIASLYATSLEDLQAADRVIGLRMLDVRKFYLVALFAAIPTSLVMVCNLVNWFIALLGLVIAFAFMMHMVHADFVTTEALCKSHVNVRALRQEHELEARMVKVAHRLWSKFNHLTQHASLKAFRERLATTECLHDETALLREATRRSINGGAAHDAVAAAAAAGATSFMEAMHSMHSPAHELSESALSATAETSRRAWPLPHVPHVWRRHSHSCSRGEAVHTGEMGLRSLLGKTPSSQGPCALLKSVAMDRAGFVGRHHTHWNWSVIQLLAETPSPTPTSPRYWSLDDEGQLDCYPSEEAWARGDAPKVRVQMKEYAALGVHSTNGLPCIALLPLSALEDGADPTGQMRSWYLCGWPATLKTASLTDVWLTKLQAASGLDAHSVHLKAIASSRESDEDDDAPTPPPPPAAARQPSPPPRPPTLQTRSQTVPIMPLVSQAHSGASEAAGAAHPNAML